MNSNLVTLTVDNNLRTITVPQEGIVFGVVGDVSVNRVCISLPRYFGGFDMSEFTPRVNYVNPNGDANYYEADDMVKFEDTAKFTWLMSSDVTSYMGDVKFSIKLYKKEGEKIIKAFNTMPASGKVRDGYDVEKQITPEQQTTLLSKLEASLVESIDSHIEEKLTEAKNELTTATTAHKNELNEAAINAVNQATDRAETAERNAKVSEEAAAEHAKKAEGIVTELDAAREKALKSIDDKKVEGVNAVEKQKETSKQSVTEHTDREILRVTQKANEISNSLNKSITEASNKKSALDESVNVSAETKKQLDLSIKSGKNTKADLDQSIENSTNAKSNLDGSVAETNTIKTELTEAIETASTLDGSLGIKIEEGKQVAKKNSSLRRESRRGH